MQYPAHLNVSVEASFDRAQTSPRGPGKAGAGDPLPGETLLSGVSAGEISRFSAKESTGRTAGAGRRDTCQLGPYGVPLLDASAACSLDRAQRSPGKARAADPPAKERGRSWIRLGASAQEVRLTPTDPPEAGILLMEGEQCSKWVDGQVNPIETFHCPTRDNQWKEMFCCGTCTDSYCCSSTKERLDQGSCPKVKTEAQGPKESAGPTVEKLNVTVGLLEFIFLAVGLSTIFTAFLCILRYWIECTEARVAQRVANAQQDLARGVRAAPVADSPPPGRAASAAPEESQSPSELPMAVANVPWGSGNRRPEVTEAPVFVLEGPRGGCTRRRERGGGRDIFLTRDLLGRRNQASSKLSPEHWCH